MNIKIKILFVMKLLTRKLNWKFSFIPVIYKRKNSFSQRVYLPN